MLDGAITRVVTVQVGVVGATWTQITNGLQAGDQVVLATVSEPLPSSATNVTTNTNEQLTGNPFAGWAQPTSGRRRDDPAGEIELGETMMKTIFWRSPPAVVQCWCVAACGGGGGSSSTTTTAGGGHRPVDHGRASGRRR